ncbi:Tubulin polyglutamylase ttll6 [Rhizoclosmatium sp. JEL0117]|nr:Tubulin polyglutamylase ttll6 [Rhizoclosmatium sp. JEL0117]
MDVGVSTTKDLIDDSEESPNIGSLEIGSETYQDVRESTPSDDEDDDDDSASDEIHLVNRAETPRTTAKKRASKLKKKKVTINTTCCKYDIVRKCSVTKGLRVVDDTEPWTLFWIDTGVSVQRVLEMQPYQKINHFPGMQEICRKNNLARNLGRLSRLLPKEYNFFPKTFVLPYDWEDLRAAMKAKKNQTYIAKPDHGCQGKGIFLFRSLKAINPHKESKLIVQMYLNKPCLIDQFKFDLRVYVLVTSVNPLRIFIHRDGLARFATEKYVDPTHGHESNLNDVCMHLTNYAINKHSSNFDYTESDDKGSKRTIESVFNRLLSRGSIKDPEELWKKINDAIVKTCITVQPQLAMILKACFPAENRASSPSVESIPAGRRFKEYTGSQCFELLGFDIFLDKKLKPWVLEVNHSPSFTCDSPLDLEVKQNVIGDTLGLLNLSAMTKKKFEKVEKEKIKSRLFGGVVGGTLGAKKGVLGSGGDTHSKQSSSTASLSAGKPPVSSTTLKSSTFMNPITSSKPINTQPIPPVAPTRTPEDLIEEYHSTYSPAFLESLTKYEDSHIGSFRRVFPPPDSNTPQLVKYLKCLEAAKKLSPDTAATKGRQELLRKQAEDKEKEIQKMEKWKAAVNEKGVVRDGSGVVRKVTSKFMTWRSKHQLAFDASGRVRRGEETRDRYVEAEENLEGMPAFDGQVPFELRGSTLLQQSISTLDTFSGTSSRASSTAFDNLGPENGVLSHENVDLVNTWLQEEPKPNRRPKPGLPKHLYKHLPMTSREASVYRNGSGETLASTSHTNSVFNQSITSASDVFPVRPLPAQRARSASRRTINLLASVGQSSISLRNESPPIEQLAKAIGFRRQSIKGREMPGVKQQAPARNGMESLSGIVGRKFISTTDQSGIRMDLPGYTNLARK